MARAPSVARGTARRAGGRRLDLGRKVALAALSALATLFVLEGVARAAGYEPIYSTYSRPEMFWRADAQLGWTMTPQAKGTYVGPRPFPVEFRAPVRINALGFRGPELSPLPTGGKRVALLGDSQAVGFEVAWSRTYGVIATKRAARDLHEPVELVNAAVRGYGTDQEYLIYLERVSKLHPDVVVLHVTSNDPDDNTTLHRARRPFGKPAFVERGGRLREVGTPVPRYPFCSSYHVAAPGRIVRTDTPVRHAVCWLEATLTDHSALFSFVARQLAHDPRLVSLLYDVGSERASVSGPQPASGAARAVAPPAIDFPHRLTSDLILALARAVRSGGARFILMGGTSDFAGLDLAALDRAGIVRVSLDAALDAPGARFPDDGHLTPEGHRRVAALLLPALETALRP